MKIAIYYNISFSGAKRAVYEHVKGLKKHGNSVDVYTTDETNDIFNPSLAADNTFVYKFSPKDLKIPIASRIKSDFIDTFINLKKLHKKIAKEIDLKNYDIVLVHTDISTQAPYILRSLKTKNVYFCLEPLRNAYEYSLRLKNDVFFLNRVYENINRWIRKEIDKKNTLHADKILSLSLFGRERIIAAYDLYPKISYLGVDESVFKPLGIKKKKQIFFVADKSYVYGYDLAKKAIELIPRKIRPELKVVEWKKNNKERLSDFDLAKQYNESILTLSLSRFDTFGLVPLESMACGVPVIALNVAGYREIILNNKTGFLVDFNSKEIADKIIFLLKNSKETEIMGKAARKRVEKNWTWKIHIKRLNKLLKEFVLNEDADNG
jgi:glycosyltransferase involved in cell wall biosynthesis